MRKILVTALAIASLAGSAHAAGAQGRYHHIDRPPDPAAQLAEMVALYDEICLRTFPDDRAVADRLAARGATPLTREQVHIFLHDDPGVGWHVAGRAAEFDLTVEAPPYHACSVRTIAAAPFPEMAPYRRVADGFESGKPFDRMTLRDHTGDGVHSWMGGEFRKLPSGGGESLLVVTGTPTEEYRAKGDDMTEIRFVHQLVDPGAR